MRPDRRERDAAVFPSRFGVTVDTKSVAVDPGPTRSGPRGMSRDIARRGRAGDLLRTPLAPGVADAKIVLSVLVQILGGDPVAAYPGFPRQCDVTFEDLMSGAANPGIATIAFKGLIMLCDSWLLLERAV